MPTWTSRVGTWLVPAAFILACLAAPASAVTITGTLKSNTGAVVANADIDAIDQCSGANVFIATDHTAADGTFSIQLPAGTYDLHFIPPAGSTLVAGDRQDFVVTNNLSLGIVTLSPGPLLAGTILTPALAAAASVDLKFTNVATNLRVFITKAVSDAAGHWSVRVPSGTWTLDFRPATGSPYADTQRIGLVVGAGDLTGLTDTLRAGFAVSGIVRDRNNVAIPNVDISAFDECTGNEIATAHDNTDATGAFSVVAPAGTYTLTINPPACKVVQAWRVTNQVVSGAVNLGTFSLAAGVIASGVMHNPDGSAMVDARLKFFDDNQVGVPRVGTTRDHTNATGAFSVVVAPSTYDINVEPPTGSTARVLHVNNTRITNNTGLGTLTAAAGLTLASTVQGTGAIPLLNVDINVHDHATGTPQHLAHDATDVTGHYAVVIAPGTYDVQYDPPVCDGRAPVQLDSLVINGPVTLPVTTLANAIHLTGTVTDGTSPVAGVDLEVLPTGGGKKLFTPNAQTPANGTFDLRVPAGTYDVHYIAPAGTRLISRSVTYPPESVSVSLPTVALSSGFLVSQGVQDATTLAAIPDVRVDVTPAGGKQPAFVPHNVTSATGGYTLAMPAGQWTFHYVPPAGSGYDDALAVVTVGGDVLLPPQSLVHSATGVAPPAAPGLELAAPQPNPARNEVRFEFQAPHGRAMLSIWDLSGRRIASLWDGPATGLTTVRWDAKDSGGRPVPPGIYLVRLTDSVGESRLGRVSVMP